MKLSDTQRIILSQASQRDDRLAIPPERLPAAARQTVAKSLIKQELVCDGPAEDRVDTLGVPLRPLDHLIHDKG